MTEKQQDELIIYHHIEPDVRQIKLFFYGHFTKQGHCFYYSISSVLEGLSKGN